MKIICNRNDLLIGVNTVLKGVSTRTTLPILQCILLQTNNDKLKLVSNDLEIGIESTVSANIIETGSIAIEAKIFSEIVKRLPDSNIEITVDENNLMSIKCEKSNFNIPGQNADEFIPLPNVSKDNKIILSQFSLKEMIRQTIFSISLEEIRPILTGELIEIKKGKLNMVSVDGFRISIRSKEIITDIQSLKVVVPGKSLNELYKILSNDEEKIKIYFTDKHILFEISNSIVVTRLLEGDFPNYEQIFSKDYETLIHINRKKLYMGIERAALIARESNKNPIKFQVSDNNLIITSNTEIGNVYEEIEIIKEGREIEIAFNPKYLLDALKVIDDEEIVLQFTNALNPCIIRQMDVDDYKYLILPIRLNG